MKETSTCLREARHASPTLLPGFEEALTTPEAISPSSLSGWLTERARAGLFGKMFRASCQAGAEAILPAFYRCCADGKYPCLKRDGETPESSPTLLDVSDWLGEFWTLNLPEYPCSREPSPNGDGGCSSSDTVAGLSDILLTGNIPPRYFLTAKCANGILRRAEKRHRELPPLLKAALTRQSEAGNGILEEKGNFFDA